MAACFYFIEERFMRMSDVFNLPLVAYDTIHDYKVIRDDFDVSCSEGDYDGFEDAATYAINNHDRMADEIAELRKENNKLKAMIDNGLGWEDMKGGKIEDVS